ncbi:amino acid ABC transporter permease [Herbaspirillum frisingense]|uniref:amino acid ABC transporter permease n=1 Tax=Herbaspirillum frisingense TaxID=92645 RepID=UPI001F2A0F56|nr:amino acid ABC transporter permease [Herbaspirillum frisingense]UIN19392.1 amino acid ABC transporter permease [Herbaspirillum frisingense]
MSTGTDVHGATHAAALDVRLARTPLDKLQIALWLITLTGLVKLLWMMAHNEAFQWSVAGHWFSAHSVLQGLGVTLGLTAVSMVLGSLLGLVLAIARLSTSTLFKSIAALYIWFFRSTPVLVQLIFLYNMATLFPQVSVGIPFGPTLMTWKTNDLITPLTAAIVGLTLNEAAYMAEIIRGGLLAVDARQLETAQAFGASHWCALRRIIIPQAMRSIVPPTGNQLISMLKATSLVSVIAMGDLLHSVQTIYNRTFEVIPLLMVAVAWYLVLTSLLAWVQAAIERYYSRSDHRPAHSDAKASASHEGVLP